MMPADLRRFWRNYFHLFGALEVAEVWARKLMVKTTDGSVWAFNGHETFYRLGTGQYRRM